VNNAENGVPLKSFQSKVALYFSGVAQQGDQLFRVFDLPRR
jgi:hypothetical protein